jgi:hypothetical protein
VLPVSPGTVNLKVFEVSTPSTISGGPVTVALSLDSATSLTLNGATAAATGGVSGNGLFTTTAGVAAGTTVVAGTTVTAGTGITSTLGNIVSTAGNVTAGAAVSATTTVAAGTTVTGGTGVIATTGGVTASAGDIVATLGNVAATAGSVAAGTTVTSGTGATSGLQLGTGTTSVPLTALSGNAACDIVITPKGSGMVTTAGTDLVAGNVKASGSNFISTYASGPAIFAGSQNGGGTAVGVSLEAQPANTTSYVAGDLLVRVKNNGSIKLTVNHAGKLTLDATDSTGTPGPAVVNKPSGQAKIASGDISVAITNSLVTTASIVFAVLQGTDATLTQLLSVIPGSGSFTITGNVIATADVQVGWVVFN